MFKKSKTLALSNILTGLIILITLLASVVPVSVSPDARKPVARETLAKRNPAGKRSISLLQARQHLITADFFREGNLLHVVNSQPQLARLVRIRLYEQGKSNPDRLKIRQAIHPYASRSADDLVNIS